MIHVLIVEDDPMARKLFEIILQESDRYIVTAAIESASLAEFYCMTSTVDLILMDVCTALRSSGLEAAAKIKKIYPKKKIIIVTSQPECDFVERARKSGVESFWYKDPSAEHLLDVMDRTMRGESVYPDKDTAILHTFKFSTDSLKQYSNSFAGKKSDSSQSNIKLLIRFT